VGALEEVRRESEAKETRAILRQIGAVLSDHQIAILCAVLSNTDPQRAASIIIGANDPEVQRPVRLLVSILGGRTLSDPEGLAVLVTGAVSAVDSQGRVKASAIADAIKTLGFPEHARAEAVASVTQGKESGDWAEWWARVIPVATEILGGVIGLAARKSPLGRTIGGIVGSEGGHAAGEYLSQKLLGAGK